MPLTSEMVDEMQARYLRGESQTQLAHDFGVSQPYVSRKVKHLTGGTRPTFRMTPDEAYRHYVGDALNSPDAGCITWPGPTNSDTGYGVFMTQAVRRFAHRYTYEQLVGPIPDGLVVRHTCDNPPCINPGHLLVGTQRRNIHDAVDRDRIRFGEKHPHHKLSEHDVREMRRLYATGHHTQDSLGELFGVGQSRVSAIVRGTAWVRLT